MNNLIALIKNVSDEFASRVALARVITDEANAGLFDDFCSNRSNNATIKLLRQETCKSDFGDSVISVLIDWLDDCYTDYVDMKVSDLEIALYKALDLDLDDYYSDDV